MEKCEYLNNTKFVLGWLLLVGTVVSFLPQHLKIWKLKTHYGLSLENFALSSLATFFSLLQFLGLGWHSTFECCGVDVSAKDCLGNYLALGQLLMIVTCTHIIVALFVKFYDHRAARALEEAAGSEPGRDWRHTKLAVVALIVVEVLLTMVWLVIGFSTGFAEKHCRRFGAVIGVAASLLVLYHWTPQILMTYRMKSAGSLSLLMLGIQCIGNLLTAYNLSSHGNFLIWGSNIASALMQVILVTLGLRFMMRDRRLERLRKEQGDAGEAMVTLDEQESEDSLVAERMEAEARKQRRRRPSELLQLRPEEFQSFEGVALLDGTTYGSDDYPIGSFPSSVPKGGPRRPLLGGIN